MCVFCEKIFYINRGLFSHSYIAAIIWRFRPLYLTYAKFRDRGRPSFFGKKRGRDGSFMQPLGVMKGTALYRIIQNKLTKRSFGSNNLVCTRNGFCSQQLIWQNRIAVSERTNSALHSERVQCNSLTASCQTIDEVRSAKGVRGKKLPRQNLTNICRYSFDHELDNLKTQAF